MLSVLIAALLLQASAPAAEASKPITDPKWAATPSEADIKAAYPGAGGLVSPGKAAVACKVTPEGDLADCKVVGEYPDYVGFGQAALQLTDKFKLKPEDGPVLAGRTVVVEVAFPGR